MAVAGKNFSGVGFRLGDAEIYRPDRRLFGTAKDWFLRGVFYDIADYGHPLK